MVKIKKNQPLFLGLTHIGQVFSKGWSKKIGKCSIFDFNKSNLEKFRENNFTLEEPKLKKIQIRKKITFLKNENEITSFKLIFFTYDTPLNKKNGYPNLFIIEKFIKKLLSLKFKKNTVIVITSQVYPGFMDKIKKKYKSKKNIKLLYMVDTLKMGHALKNFLYPNQLIFGGEFADKKFIKKYFNKFKCKKYFFSFKEAELIKISINLYLYFSVTYANILDEMGRDNNISFSKILNVLRNDPRIGTNSYIHPSLGISGGHLERDSFYFQKINKNLVSKKILSEMMNFNNLRKNILESEIKNLKHNKILNILIVGVSYKKESFSVVNSFFSNLIHSRKYKVRIFDDKYNLDEFNKNKILQDLRSLKSFDVVIYNYSNNNNIKIIKKFLKKNKKKYLLNISFDKKNEFNGPNVKNLFSKELDSIN